MTIHFRDCREVMRKLEAGTGAGDLVLDPLMGAGTTAVVADRLGRRYVGAELNPEYAAIASQRLAGRTMGLAFG